MDVLDLITHEQICKVLNVAPSTGHNIRRNNPHRYLIVAKGIYMESLPNELLFKIINAFVEYGKAVKLDTIKRMS